MNDTNKSKEGVRENRMKEDRKNGKVKVKEGVEEERKILKFDLHPGGRLNNLAR